MPESNKNNNNGSQRPIERPTLDHGDFQKRNNSNGRTTTTDQKPAPGHKK